MEVTRRRFLGVTAAVVAGYALKGCAGLLLRQRQDYGTIMSIVDSLGYGINEKFCRNTTKDIRVFLEDRHDPAYEKIQAERILALDSLIDFDMIGIEGLSGKIPDTRDVQERFVSWIRQYVENTSMDVRLFGVEEFMTLEMAYDFIDTYPSPLAPGFPYCNLPTRAPKIGMEDRAIYESGEYIASAIIAQEVIGNIENIVGNKGEFEFNLVMARIRGMPFTDNAADNILDFLRGKLPRIRQIREKFLYRLPEDIQACIKKMDLSEDILKIDCVADILIDECNMAWDRNMRYDRAMMIGGVGHTEHFYNNTQSSMITLRLPEP